MNKANDKISPFAGPIYVTRPFLPPLEDFYSGLHEIWSNRWLTNEGPVLRRFEKKLYDYFQTENICLFTNGTLALQLGLQGMDIRGEVITTPFTFPATIHTLYWNKLRPVFSDIEPDTYTLDPDKAEELITPWTSAILAVHVFGRPCYLERLQEIADRHNLKLIYDAAHAFGVRINGSNIGTFGDMSMFSFHATKLFHSLEGGMLVFRDEWLKKTFNYLKNFGFENELEVVMPGTNAKMNELQALTGDLNFAYIQEILDKHRLLYDIYKYRLEQVEGLEVPPDFPSWLDPNCSFFPVQVDPEKFKMGRDGLYYSLREYNVFPRRYFYPLVSDFPCYRSLEIRSGLDTAKRVSSRILNLPIYYDLSEQDVHKICDILLLLQSKR